MVMSAGMADDVLFCINGTEHRVNRDSEVVKDTLNDYLRRRTPYKVRSETLAIPTDTSSLV